MSQAATDAYVSLNFILSKLCTYTSGIHNLHKSLFVAESNARTSVPAYPRGFLATL